MDKFICEDCGRVLTEDEIESWIEPHGEELSGCPSCGGNVVEAEECSVCGKDYATTSLRAVVWHGKGIDDLICENCRNNILEEFTNILKEHYKNDELKDFKQQVINDYLVDEDEEINL